jgi:endonuclease V-like protein UPF0215 family
MSSDTSSHVIGIDDGPFTKQQETAPIVAALLEGFHLQDFRIARVTVDGLDATGQAIKLVRGWKPAPILLSGVTFAGFNIINPHVLQKKFRVPVIVVVGSRPDNRAVKRALVKHFPDWKRRWRIISSLGPLRTVLTNPDEPPIYFEFFGCSRREAASLLKASSCISRLPEPIRVAGLVATGLFAAKTKFNATPALKHVLGRCESR